MFASRVLKQTAAGSSRVLTRNIPVQEYYPRGPWWGFEIPNYTRTPLLKLWWLEHFTTPNLYEFGGSWATFITIVGFLMVMGFMDRAPLYRYDQHYMNSERYRIINAWYNEGKRPALEMAKFAGWVRYTLRGLDHPFSLSEKVDIMFKEREQYLIARNPGVQYPYVFRNYQMVDTPSELRVNLYPALSNPKDQCVKIIPVEYHDVAKDLHH